MAMCTPRAELKEELDVDGRPRLKIENGDKAAIWKGCAFES